MSNWLMKNGKWVAVAAVVVVAGAWWWHGKSAAPAGDAGKAAAAAPAASRHVKPALSVQVVSPQSAQWPSTLTANGSIAAWQEAIIGAELSGLRVATVLVNVGDRVKRGQPLATLQNEAVQADVNTARANLAEAQALLAEAKSNADRSRSLRGSGAISAQEAQRDLTAEATAQARMESLKARLAADELRLRQTTVVAPDDGVISARVASVGSMAQPGQEMFRLIRQGRLEWRAELPSADLVQVKPGMPAWATPPGGSAVQGVVRTVAPTVDAGTRNGLVYVDLPASAVNAGARAGMFANGRFETGQAAGLSLPQSAVLLRDGFSYVFTVNDQGVVSQVKVDVGRRRANRIEITKGLKADTQVVASGVGFLTDGDTVRIVKGQS
ncbi:efflux RND transporter periplasmic adaptor subunit [Aquabacterium sp. CECT 9606]|uniref:efflux RND transporter periplasmic adaptor subunit n=1 Tax=Aquabacterium sp. CECT 9606 TaxID=2845822 RepID=UPI001E65AF44|nr:efflux RND transporter periplasmic adaptor subunit [Aquabacterium sp. CECT 9606]CAH0354928.1 Multidrug resistance protein MdtA [Aquabacterium sp. CECT 9606]